MRGRSRHTLNRFEDLESDVNQTAPRTDLYMEVVADRRFYGCLENDSGTARLRRVDMAERSFSISIMKLLSPSDGGRQ